MRFVTETGPNASSTVVESARRCWIRPVTASRVAEAAVDQASQRVQILEEGVRTERIAAQRAVVAQADAAMRRDRCDPAQFGGHGALPGDRHHPSPGTG